MTGSTGRNRPMNGSHLRPNRRADPLTPTLSPECGGEGASAVGEPPATKRTQATGARFGEAKSLASIPKLPKGKPKRGESPCLATLGFSGDVSLPTDSTRPRDIPQKSPTARKRGRLAASSPRATLCQRTRHIREQRVGRWRQGEAPVWTQRFHPGHFSLPTDSTRPREVSRGVYVELESRAFLTAFI